MESFEEEADNAPTDQPLLATHQPPSLEAPLLTATEVLEGLSMSAPNSSNPKALEDPPDYDDVFSSPDKTPLGIERDRIQRILSFGKTPTNENVNSLPPLPPGRRRSRGSSIAEEEVEASGSSTTPSSRKDGGIAKRMMDKGKSAKGVKPKSNSKTRTNLLPEVESMPSPSQSNSQIPADPIIDNFTRFLRRKAGAKGNLNASFIHSTLPSEVWDSVNWTPDKVYKVVPPPNDQADPQANGSSDQESESDTNTDYATAEENGSSDEANLGRNIFKVGTAHRYNLRRREARSSDESKRNSSEMEPPVESAQLAKHFRSENLPFWASSLRLEYTPKNEPMEVIRFFGAERPPRESGGAANNDNQA